MNRQETNSRQALPAYTAAAVCLLCTAARVMTLSGGSAADRFLVLSVLLALGALAVVLLRRSCPALPLHWAVFAVAAAILLRALCLDYKSGDYNTFLSRWAAYFRENGGFRAISANIGDYNAPYLYFVAAISYLGTPDLYLYKLFSILFDVLLAWGCLRVTVLTAGDERPYAGAAAFVGALLLPTVILNGAYWGQCDSIYAALTLHALALLMEERPVPSLAVLAAAFSFKLQTIFLIPLWGAAWLAGRVRFRQLFVFPAAYALTILPALMLGKPLGDILGVYFNQMGEYGKLTLNAPSVFQFLPYKEAVNETLLSALGVAAAMALALAVLAAGFALRGRLDSGALLGLGVVLAIGVPFFLPHMHERYFYLADVLTLCWACTARRRLPVCVLAAGSSLACYLVYLRLKYNLVLTVGDHRFVMAVEAVAMLAALVLSVVEFIRIFKECNAKPLDRRNEG